jgi:hypothetical protein
MTRDRRAHAAYCRAATRATRTVSGERRRATRRHVSAPSLGSASSAYTPGRASHARARE